MSLPKSSEIGLDQAIAGMALAAALLDDHGAVLVPQDATLTTGMLASLRRRGVERCLVWSADGPDPAELARERECRLQRLEWLFRHRSEAGCMLLLAQLRAYYSRESA
ncbi:hypothetical protein ACHAC9_05460 [Massilia sp. CMS3.1]|uniref:hypothetical protein n=1 Tax=Massilia sp. CMS3.1 TaxID=3373083 RepID=UPI003EE44F2C